jgi:hypothetical protein
MFFKFDAKSDEGLQVNPSNFLEIRSGNLL